jgi:hypothetical protein
MEKTTKALLFAAGLLPGDWHCDRVYNTTPRGNEWSFAAMSP